VVVVEAYFLGYLDGMREEADGMAAPDRAPREASEEAASNDLADAPAPPSLAELEIRARLEGYADGRRWRERMKSVGGVARGQNGSSSRPSTEMRSPSPSRSATMVGRPLWKIG